MNDRLDALIKRVESDFAYHPNTTGEVANAHQFVRDSCFALAMNLVHTVPDGRELSLALTNLEQAMMWSNAAIARTQRVGS